VLLVNHDPNHLLENFTLSAIGDNFFEPTSFKRALSNERLTTNTKFVHARNGTSTTSANPLADGTTHEIHWPWGKPLRRSRLDYIFLKAEETQWKLLEALHLETPGEKHSDHRAVMLRFAPAYIKS